MGGERDLYQSYFLQAVDRKGRVTIPVGLRAAIENNSGERTLLIGDHDSGKCMVGYDRNWSRLLKARVDKEIEDARVAGAPIDRSDAGLHNFGNVDAVVFDEAGRFLMPEYVIDRAQLSDLAFFVGMGDTFQIWSPEVLLATKDVREGTRNRCEWLMSKRKAAA